MSNKKEMKTCEEEYPIGTKVMITRDCRRIKRATGKEGVIVKYLHYIIPKDYFPLTFRKKEEKIEISIENLEEDLKGTMPIIKYGSLAKIKGNQCFWSSIENLEKMKKLKNKIEKEVEHRLATIKKTFIKTQKFLTSLIVDFWKIYRLELEFPMIFPGIAGDIDIEWKNDKFQLLISIPENKESLAGLYGSDYAEDEIKLDFDISKQNLKLLSWLKKQHQNKEVSS